jgi:hypothetical protein
LQLDSSERAANTQYRYFLKETTMAKNKYPPAEPEVLRLLAPQRGLTAIGHSQNPNTGDGVLQYPGNVKLWESPRQSRGFSPINKGKKKK